jgi:hypothetical protein
VEAILKKKACIIITFLQGKKLEMKNAISKVKTVRSFRVVPKCRQDFDVDIEGCAEDVR